MRTTVNIDDGLFDQIKQLAASRRQSMGSVIEDALREAVNRTTRSGAIEHIDLPISKQPPGLCPGVDLDNSASLLDIMEAQRDPG